ncbi:hypothetical protein [Streptomyces sp. NPDC002403]
MSFMKPLSGLPRLEGPQGPDRAYLVTELDGRPTESLSLEEKIRRTVVNLTAFIARVTA